MERILRKQLPLKTVLEGSLVLFMWDIVSDVLTPLSIEQGETLHVYS